MFTPKFSLPQNFWVRFTGALFISVIIWNFFWVTEALNYKNFYISLPFLVGISMVYIYGITAVINSWNISKPKLVKLDSGKEPMVVVLIPTCGEPIEMVLKTLDSVRNQDWPKNKLLIVVGDDKHNLDLKKELESLEFSNLIYHEPPLKNSPFRKGESKAGNLQSCLEFVMKKYPEIEYIETRDADDLVGTVDFLRYCLKALEDNPKASFVQTIKKCIVPDKDPFSSQEPEFYERTMLTRQAGNAAFPCGSGLVWRVSELKKINGFPGWNLVEDLHSGYEVLSLGGQSIYLPIVGALGQIAPEDIPNLYKQRGTWALDSLRLFLWKNPFFRKGLNFRQKMQFFELFFSYILNISVLFFIFSIFIGLVFEIYPVAGDSWVNILNISLFAFCAEVFYIAKAGHISYKEQWRSRQIWTGLTFVYIMAMAKALSFGPNRKPKYVITRKERISGWYVKEILLQLLVVTLLLSAIFYSLTLRGNFHLEDIVSIFWASYFIYSFWQVLALSIFGVVFFKQKVTTSWLFR